VLECGFKSNTPFLLYPNIFPIPEITNCTPTAINIDPMIRVSKDFY